MVRDSLKSHETGLTGDSATFPAARPARPRAAISSAEGRAWRRRRGARVHDGTATGEPPGGWASLIGHQTIDAGGLRMHVAPGRPGPPVLLVHGVSQCW